MIHVLFNSLSDAYNGKKNSEKLLEIFKGEELEFEDITKIDIVKYASETPKEDKIIICGGDGTLNHLVNDFNGQEPPREIMFFPAGTGNDFINDITPPGESKERCVVINPYIKNLPKVYVNGMEKYFINGVGYGIDGYCCEEGDRLKAEGATKINYAGIAIKGVLGKYKATNATIIADGKTYTFHNALLAPTMKGRFYGGGMMATPSQDRNDPEKKVTCMVYLKKATLTTLAIFPSIFKGEHVKHKKMVTIIPCSEITVKFASPRALQIDGETVKNVLTYTVKTQF